MGKKNNRPKFPRIVPTFSLKKKKRDLAAKIKSLGKRQNLLQNIDNQLETLELLIRQDPTKNNYNDRRELSYESIIDQTAKKRENDEIKKYVDVEQLCAETIDNFSNVRV